MCWGGNTKGQLGDGTMAGSNVPVAVVGSGGYTSPSAGLFHTCALSSSDAYCWGDDSQGQLGNGASGPSATPSKVVGGIAFIQVKSGKEHVCGIDTAGQAYCWGSDSHGQLGNGALGSNVAPEKISGLAGVTDVSAGDRHTCAVADQRVYCWGDDDRGQLGNGPAQASPVPVQLEDFGAAVQLAAGTSHTCARTAKGEVFCWGDNTHGQLQTSSLSPLKELPNKALLIPLSAGVRSIAAGGDHTCAIDRDWQTRCWGSGSYGMHGNDDDSPGDVFGAATTVPVDAIGFHELSLGAYHTCAVGFAGEVWCFGRNNAGQLGISPAGVASLLLSPATVPGSTSSVKVATGEHFTCSLLANGDVRCWGKNLSGQLGHGTASNDPTHPFQSPLTLSNATEITAGAYHACALVSGQAWCWGYNGQGQLGDLNRPNVDPSPKPVPGLSGLVELDSGAFHTCARSSSGVVWCWGKNSDGALGDGSPAAKENPVSPSLPAAAVSLTAGGSTDGSHTCAVTQTQELFCWGSNESQQLGFSGEEKIFSPTKVPNLTGVTHVDAGRAHTCARRAEFGPPGLWCWGNDTWGQVGNGKQEPLSSPTSVIGMGASTLFSLGGDATCVSDGTQVRCWGFNNTGGLGDGSMIFKTSPTVIPGWGSATDISVGTTHTCSVTANAVRCSGSGFYGELGNGGIGYANEPRKVLGIAAPLGPFFDGFESF